MPPIIDLHQDLLPHIEARSVYGDVWQTSWSQLEASPVRIVVASTWPGDRVGGVLSPAAREANEHYMAGYAALAGESADWTLVLASDDVEHALEGGARGVVVHVEGLPRLEGPVEPVFNRWFELGCRSVGLMWNEANGLGFGPEDPRGGLTERGRRAAEWLDGHPVVVDTAHMGEATFWDTLSATSGPVLASHANARALCDHPRNLRDDQLRAIADRGGVVGVAFTTMFLGETGGGGAARVVDHIEHIAEVVGVEHVAVGSDFGGIVRGGLPDLASVERVGLLLDEMSSRGLSEESIGAIASGNAARVLQASLAKHSAR